MVSIGVATIIGNGSVLVALTRARRAPSHYPLASLATADFLVGVFVLPIGAVRELFVIHLNSVLCSFWSTLDVLCCTASILSLCALGWERWSGITAPLARVRRTKRAKLFAILVWPVATIVAIPTAFVPSPKHFLPGEVPKACTVNTNTGYVFFSAFMSFYLPACVMLTFYARILSALSAPPTIRAHRGGSPSGTQLHTPSKENGLPKSNGTANKNYTPNQNVTPKQNGTPKCKFKTAIQKVTIIMSPGNRLNVPSTNFINRKLSFIKNSVIPGNITLRQKKATRTIIMLMFLFLICWTPFFVMLPIDSLCECVWAGVWEWCTWLGYINSALNPIVYAASSPSVRCALKSLTNSTSTRSDIPMSPRGVS